MPARSVHTRLIRYAQDKACIDQNSIQQSLACLPVFLAGCQTLLVVAGPTYCSRLWCVMELFTFARSERPLLIRTLLDCADATVEAMILISNKDLHVPTTGSLSYAPLTHGAGARVSQWAATKIVSRSISSPTRTMTRKRRDGC